MVARAAEPPLSSPDVAAFFQRLRAGEKATVLVYGTSLTEHGAWTNLLARWFDTRYPGRITFINSGGSGQNSDWGVKNLQAKVLDRHPDLVFIEFSYNDCVTRFKLTPEHARENLDGIVKAIQSANPRVAVVLQTMNVPWDSPKGSKISASVRPQLDTFNEVYRAYAREHRLTLLDHYQAWLRFKETEPEKYQASVPDGTHPNVDGINAVTWPEIEAFVNAAASAAK